MLFHLIAETVLGFSKGLFVDKFGEEDFVIDTPADDLTVNFCVRDYGCVDGDKIRLYVNSQKIFDGELFWEATCVSSQVNAGDNTVTMYAINGTGGKGHCPNNVNTGEISIGHGEISADNIDWKKQQWGLSPDTEKTGILKINVEQ